MQLLDNTVSHKHSSHRVRAHVIALLLILILTAVPVLCADTTDPTVTIDETETQVKDTVTLSAEISDDTAIQFGTCEWCISTSSTSCTSDWTSDNVTETAPSMSEDQGQVDSLVDDTSLTSMHDRLTQSIVAGADQTQSAATDNEQDFASAGGAELDVKQDSDTSSQGASTYGSRYAGQYFEPTSSGDLMEFEMYIKRYEPSSLPDDLEVRLYAADGNHKPTGSLLASTIIAKEDTSTDGSWVNATFATPYALTSGNGYAIYIKTENGGGTSSNHYRWRGCPNTDCYDEGDFLFSLNGGSTWYVYDNDDRAFRAWIASGGDNTKLSQSFTAGGTYTMDRIALVLSRDGTPSESLNVSIYSDTDDDDEPNALLSKVSVGSGEVGASAQWMIASGLSAALTSGSQYCIVLEVADADKEVWKWWGSDTTADTYTGGKFLTKVGEAAWSDTDANADRAFMITNGKGVYNAEKLMLRLRRYFPVLDQYNDKDSSRSIIYGVREYGQTFTAGGTEYLAKLELYLYEYGTGSSHELNISLYATDGSGYPTGAPLISRTFLRSELQPTPQWFEVVFPEPPYLSSGTKYAIVLKCPDCPNSSNSMRWRYKYATQDPYGDGQLVRDTGGGWEALDAGSDYYDHTFRTYYNDPNGRWAVEQASFSGNSDGWVHSTYYQGMAFRPQHDIEPHELDLYLYKTGSPSDLVVEIRNVTRDDDDCKNPEACGEMTATVLATATVSASDVGTSLDWVTATFSSPPELAAHQLYAIVARQTGDGGDSSNRYNWRRSSDSADFYTRGNSFTSSDSGSTWTTSSTYAYTFKMFTNYANTPTDLRVTLHDDTDRDGVPDTPTGGMLADGHEGTDENALVRDRTYRAQVFTPDVGGTLDRVEMLLHTSSTGGSDLLVSVQEAAGDHNVTAYSYTGSSSSRNIYGSTRYGANTFYPEVGTTVNRIGLKLKKAGSPNDAVVELRTADYSTGEPTSSVLASSIIPASDVTTDYQVLYANFTNGPELTPGTWYTVTLQQEDDGGDYDNRFDWAYGSSGSDGEYGWYWNGTDWLESGRHYIIVRVDGPVDFTPREDILAEERIPFDDLPESGSEDWVSVRFEEEVQLVADRKYAIVLREEGGSGEVYWHYNSDFDGDVTDGHTYLTWRGSGMAWYDPLPRQYNLTTREFDWLSHGFRVYLENGNGPAEGTIDLADVPLGSADWVASTLPGYGISASSSKVISLDASGGGVDGTHYVIWAGAPTGDDAYEAGSSGSGSVTGGGSSSSDADRGIRTWDSNSTHRSCEAEWNTYVLSDDTASRDGVEYYVHFRMDDEADNTGSDNGGPVRTINENGGQITDLRIVGGGGYRPDDEYPMSDTNKTIQLRFRSFTGNGKPLTGRTFDRFKVQFNGVEHEVLSFQEVAPGEYEVEVGTPTTEGTELKVSYGHIVGTAFMTMFNDIIEMNVKGNPVVESIECERSEREELGFLNMENGPYSDIAEKIYRRGTLFDLNPSMPDRTFTVDVELSNFDPRKDDLITVLDPPQGSATCGPGLSCSVAPLVVAQERARLAVRIDKDTAAVGKYTLFVIARRKGSLDTDSYSAKSEDFYVVFNPYLDGDLSGLNEYQLKAYVYGGDDLGAFFGTSGFTYPYDHVDYALHSHSDVVFKDAIESLSYSGCASTTRTNPFEAAKCLREQTSRLMNWKTTVEYKKTWWVIGNEIYDTRDRLGKTCPQMSGTPKPDFPLQSDCGIAGQCMDFAAVLTAFLRSVGIPARMISAEEPDIWRGSFHVLTEAYLPGQYPAASYPNKATLWKWYVFDATRGVGDDAGEIDPNYNPFDQAAENPCNPPGGTETPRNFYETSGIQGKEFDRDTSKLKCRARGEIFTLSAAGQRQPLKWDYTNDPSTAVSISSLPTLSPGTPYNVTYNITNLGEYPILGMNDTDGELGTFIHVILRDSLNMDPVQLAERESGINITASWTGSFTDEVTVPSDLTPSNYELEVAVFQKFNFTDTSWPIGVGALDMTISGVELGHNKSIAYGSTDLNLTSLDANYTCSHDDGFNVSTWEHPNGTTATISMEIEDDPSKPYLMQRVVLDTAESATYNLTIPLTSSFNATHLPGTGEVNASTPTRTELSKPYLIFYDPTDETSGDVEVIAFTKYPTIEEVIIGSNYTVVIAQWNFTLANSTVEFFIYRNSTVGGSYTEDQLFTDLTDEVVSEGDPQFYVQTGIDKNGYETNETVNVTVTIENNFPQSATSKTYNLTIDTGGYSTELEVLHENGTISLNDYETKTETFNLTLDHTHDTGDNHDFTVAYLLADVTSSEAFFTHEPLYTISLSVPENVTVHDVFNITLTVDNPKSYPLDIDNVTVVLSNVNETTLFTGFVSLDATSSQDFTRYLNATSFGLTSISAFSESVMGSNYTIRDSFDILALPSLSLEKDFPAVANATEPFSLNVTVHNLGDFDITGVNLTLASPPEVSISQSLFELGTIPALDSKNATVNVNITEPGRYQVNLTAFNGTDEYNVTTQIVLTGRHYGHQLDLLVNGVGDGAYGEEGAGGNVTVLTSYLDTMSVDLTIQNEGSNDTVWLNTSAIGIYRLEVHDANGMEVERPYHFNLTSDEELNLTFTFYLSPKDYSTTGSLPINITAYTDNDPTVLDGAQVRLLPLEVNLTAPLSGIVGDPFNLTFTMNNTASITLEFLGNLTLSSELDTTNNKELNFTLDSDTTLQNTTWNVTASSLGPGYMWVNLTVNGTALSWSRSIVLVDFNITVAEDPPQYVNSIAHVNTSCVNLNEEFGFDNLVYNLTLTGVNNSTTINETFSVLANQTRNATLEFNATGFEPGTYNATLRLLRGGSELAQDSVNITLQLQPGIYLAHFGYGVNDTFSHVYPLSGGVYSTDVNDTLAWSFFFADGQGGYVYWNEAAVDFVRIYECNNANGTDCSIDHNFTTAGTRYNATAGRDLLYFDDRFFLDEEDFTTPLNSSKTYLLRVNASHSSVSHQTDARFHVTEPLNTTAEMDLTSNTIDNSTLDITVPFNYTVNGTLTNVTSSTFVRLLVRRDDDNCTCSKWLYKDRTCVTNNETGEAWNCTTEDRLTELDTGRFEFLVELPNCTRVSGHDLELHLLVDDAGRKAARDIGQIHVQ